MGVEGAGVVVEVGSEVKHLRVGERVFGLVRGAFGPLALGDSRQLRAIPKGLSFAEAATIPTVFMTVLYALDDLANVKPGERLLVHAAAGGVGMAALQVARLRGLEVFATASQGKWKYVRERGIPMERIASSRDTAFEPKFFNATRGEGMDVVLGSLFGEIVDASLRLLPRGGRFLEMGKRDIRDAEWVNEEHPGVEYRAFDLVDAGPERHGEMMETLVQWLEAGEIAPLPLQAYDVREVERVFRWMSKGGHVGKLVLEMPRALRQEGTVLLTGAMGGLGRVMAKHLVEEHGVRHLMLLSRSGMKSEGSEAFVEELKAAGAQSVSVRACDVSKREAVAEALASIPDAHPLQAVFHLAMVLDDGVLMGLQPEQIDRVLRPKVDAAFHLDALTRDADLNAFVLFSSAAGTLNSAGQASYAAANAALDALAEQRRRAGRAGQSLAWGMWTESGGAARMGSGHQSRLRRAGFGAIDNRLGMRLLDDAMESASVHLLPMPLDMRALGRASAEHPESVSSMLRGLVRHAVRRADRVDAASGRGGLEEQLAALDEAERTAWVLAVVQGQVAAVFGMSSAQVVEKDRPLKEMGLDSLSAVELRNRLAQATGLRLPATLLFDYPTADALTRRILQDLSPRSSTVLRSSKTDTDAKHDAAEPIAIVAMSCRLPGNVDTPEALWELLARGDIPMSPLPRERGWDVEALYDPDPDVSGKMYVREAGFLEHALAFDAGFFNVSPREAMRLDPQQRLLLETSWEALEQAGIQPSLLENTQSGTYLGVIYSDYGGRLLRDYEALDGSISTGSAGSTASGRIAYTLGLQGPAISVDTACSSSLVAIHLAMQGLRQGDCDLALAGGVTVMSTPQLYIEFSRQRGLAADGKCKPFSKDADGTAFSEGCGILVLERLSDARRNGHPVLAVLRGSAVNQDGRSQGLTAPNGPSQERVIAGALASAHLDASDIDIVETHGTGTKLGDPIEAGALLATYGRDRASEQPLYLGALKSNIGHTQAASGVAGVMKMVLALQREEMPASNYADNPTDEVDWSAGNIKLLAEAKAWPRGARRRRAGVSSFGISGTNAHVIVEEAPEEAAAEEAVRASWGRVPLVLSGRTENSLRGNAERLAEHLAKHPEVALLDVGLSLATQRTAFVERMALGATDVGDAIEKLREVSRGGLPKGAVRARGTSSRVVFVYPGQGSQYAGMCRGLLSEPVFREGLEACDAALQPHTGFSVLALLGGDDEAQREALEKVTVVQPVLFAVAIALTRMWASWGVRPSKVIGHSQGEVAAAVVAGALTLEEGARVVALRSQLVSKLGSEVRWRAWACRWRKWKRSCMAFRGRVHCGGEHIAVDGGCGRASGRGSGGEAYESRGVFCRRIAVDYASHSPQMDGVLPGIREGLQGLKPKRSTVAMVSTVTGQRVEGSELGADYWADNLRKPVRLDLALEAAEVGEESVLLEVSAHPVLAAVLSSSGRERVVGTLRKDDEASNVLRMSAGELHVHGVQVEWSAMYEGSGAKAVELPTYAFDRQRYWLEAGKKSSQSMAEVGLEDGGHPLLGSRVELPDGGVLFGGVVETGRLKWLEHHRVFESVLMPGVGMLEMVLHASGEVGLDGVQEAVLEAPMLVEAGAGRRVQVVLGAEEDGEANVCVAEPGVVVWKRRGVDVAREWNAGKHRRRRGRAGSAVAAEGRDSDCGGRAL